VFSAIGIGTKVYFAVGTRKSCFALAGLGSAIAIRVGSIASNGTFSGTLGGFDNTRSDITAAAAASSESAAATGEGNAIHGGLIGRLVFGPDTGTVVEPGLVIEIATEKIATPDIFSIVLAIDEAVVATVASGNTQV
jgi:hypothetical protein